MNFTFVLDIFRSMLWFFASCALYILDLLYDLFHSIVSLKITNGTFATALFSSIAGVTIVFILYRLFKIYLKAITDEGYALNFNGVRLMWRLFFATLTLALAPSIYTYTMQTVTQWVSEDIPAIISSLDTSIDMSDQSNFKLSDVIIRGGFTDEGLTEKEKQELLDGMHNQTLLDIDINKKIDGKYVFYKDTYSIILTFAIGLMSMYCMFLISINFTIRSLTIVFKFILGPWFISGLVENDDKGFSAWIKHLSADIVSNLFQIIMFYTVIILVQQDSLYSNSSGVATFLLKPIMMFIGLLFVIQGPTGITALIGGDGMGATSALQGMQQAMHTIGVGQQVGSAVMTAAAMGVVTAGRAAGAESRVLGGHAASRGQNYNDKRNVHSDYADQMAGSNSSTPPPEATNGERANGSMRNATSPMNHGSTPSSSQDVNNSQNRQSAMDHANTNAPNEMSQPSSSAMNNDASHDASYDTPNQTMFSENGESNNGYNDNGNVSSNQDKSYTLNGERVSESGQQMTKDNSKKMVFNKFANSTRAFAKAMYDASADRLADNKRIQHFDAHTAAMYRNFKNHR